MHLIDQVLNEHRPSITKPCVNKRQRFEESSSIDGRPSIDGRSRVDKRLRIDKRSSFKIPSVIKKLPVDERLRVGQRPRIDYKLTRPNCTQIVQYCGLDQFVEGIASCNFGGISLLSWSKHHFGMKSTRRSLQPLWSRLVGRRAVDARKVQQEVQFLRRRFLQNEGDLFRQYENRSGSYIEGTLHERLPYKYINKRPLHQPVREMFWWWLTLNKKKDVMVDCHYQNTYFMQIFIYDQILCHEGV
jgi:hypothetical protein